MIIYPSLVGLSHRLSLKYEPPETPRATAQLSIATGRLSSSTTTTPTRVRKPSNLRRSRSYEDVSIEDDSTPMADTKSPFSASQRNSFTRRSLDYNSKGEVSSSDKHSIPCLVLPSKDDGVTSVGDKKKWRTVPDIMKGGSVSITPSSTPFMVHRRSHFSSVKMVGEKKWTDYLSLTSGPPSSAHPASSLSSPSIPHPSLASASSSTHSPLLTSWVRGHKKSHSLGSKYVNLVYDICTHDPPPPQGLCLVCAPVKISC